MAHPRSARWMALLGVAMAAAVSAWSTGCAPDSGQAPAPPAQAEQPDPSAVEPPAPEARVSRGRPPGSDPARAPAEPDGAPTGADAPTASPPPNGSGDRVQLVEASGLTIRGGGTVAVVCGDETRDRLWAVSLTDTSQRWHLTFPEGTPRLDDVEALAPWGEHQVVAVCSQSRTKPRQKVKPGRNRLALITLSPDGRRVLDVRIHENLRYELLRHIGSRLGGLFENISAIMAGGPNQGGLNVEGLAAWRGRLLIGLRSPLTPDGPVVIPLINPDAVFADGASPEFGEAIVLPTRPGEAIRGMTEDRGEAILVLLGPGTDAPGPPQRIVRWWPGRNRLDDVRVPDLHNMKRVEAHTLDPDGRLLVVTDYKLPLPERVFHRLTIEKP